MLPALNAATALCLYILLCNLHNDYLFYDCVFPAAEWMTIRLTIIIGLIISAIITTQPNMVGLLLRFGLFSEQMNTYCLLQKAERWFPNRVLCQCPIIHSFQQSHMILCVPNKNGCVKWSMKIVSCRGRSMSVSTYWTTYITKQSLVVRVEKVAFK